MKIVVLDGYGLNPGDLSWKDLEALGLAKPISSDAEMTIRRAMKAGSSPPSTMRASQ